MTGTARDLTFVIVGEDERACAATLESLDWQTLAPAPPLTATPSDFRRVLGEVESEWVSILPEGVQLGPDWLARALDLLGAPGVGAVGGCTLELHGAQTSAVWFEAPTRVTSVDFWGRCRSRLGDLPHEPLHSSALFLRWDNMACRTALLRKVLRASDDPTRARHATVACAEVIRHGLEVVYDSGLRAARAMGVAGLTREDSGLDTSQEIVELAGLSGWCRSKRAVASSILVGTRRSPGLLMGVAYAWWPKRRDRWRAFVGGKLLGLRRVMRDERAPR